MFLQRQVSDPPAFFTGCDADLPCRGNAVLVNR